MKDHKPINCNFTISIQEVDATVDVPTEDFDKEGSPTPIDPLRFFEMLSEAEGKTFLRALIVSDEEIPKQIGYKSPWFPPENRSHHLDQMLSIIKKSLYQKISQ